MCCRAWPTCSTLCYAGEELRAPRHVRLTARCASAEYDEPVVDLALSGAVAAVVVALWLVTRHWLFVDILGACLASESIKVSSACCGTRG